MTVSEMIIGVNIGVQKVDSNAYDNLQTEEVLYYLNKAQRKYIRNQAIYLKEKMEGNRPDFISDSEAGNNLGNLLMNDLIATGSLSDYTPFTNALSAPLTALTEVMFSFISGFAKIGTSEFVNIVEVSPSEMKKFATTTYNHPIFREYPFVQIGDRLVFFHDATVATIQEVNFFYIKEPAKLVTGTPSTGEVTTSELASHTHDSIIDQSVSMILEDLKSVKPYSKNQEPLKGKDIE